MYTVLVKVKVNSNSLRGMTYEEVLAFIKRTIGTYNEHDISKLVEVVRYKKV